jgi:acetate kinase
MPPRSVSGERNHRDGVVLVLNAGSSSLKVQLFAMAGGLLRNELRGQIDDIGAASGLAEFDELINRATEKAPARAVATIEDVGFATAALASDAARLVTGSTIYVDGGYHIID